MWERDTVDMENTNDYSYIYRNIEKIDREIAEAAKSASRSVDGIKTVAAVKYADNDEIKHLLLGGIKCIGENRVQQMLDHIPFLDDGNMPEIHFIGTLQKNKVKYLIGSASVIESADSVGLLDEIQRISEKRDTVTSVMIEINSGREENKSGVLEEDLPKICERAAEYNNIKLIGFMTMAPKCAEREDYRRYFSYTRELGQRMWRDVLGRDGKPLLSMGMSESFVQAIKEGADIVRIGRLYFDNKIIT